MTAVAESEGLTPTVLNPPPAMILIQFPLSVSSTSVYIFITSFLVVTDQEITPLKFCVH